MLEVETRCPFCGTPATVLDGLRGSPVACSRCRGQFALPQTGNTAQPIAAPGPQAPSGSRVGAILAHEEVLDVEPVHSEPVDWGDQNLNAGAGYCDTCGRRAPTGNVNFQKHIGMVILMFHSQVSGKLCKKCMSQAFWDCTLTTLLLGWWGCISMVVTPFCLLWNVINYLSAGRIPEAPE